MKKVIIVTIVCVFLLGGIILGLRFLLSGNEDTWICNGDQWVKHGHPNAPKPIGPCGKSSQMANPASVYCQEQGGKLEIRTDSSGGQFGWCTLPDGRECEEWDFFRTKVCGGNLKK